MTKLALCLIAWMLVTGSLSAQTYRSEYRLSTVPGTSFPWGQAGERWADLVRERTQGRINIKLTAGAALVSGDQTREFTAIREGMIDLAIGSTINWSPQVKELNLFSLPFFIPDAKTLDKLLQGEVGKDLFKVLESRGIVPLAWGENGTREISNSKHPIRTPADMKGMKLRVVWTPIFLDIFTALGAKPIQLSWADLQMALASGSVDGQENPLTVFNAAKMQTLGQKHLTLWRYMSDPLIFAVNKEVWSSWLPADQEAVRVAAQQAARENVEKARRGIAPTDDSLIRQLESAGVAVVIPTRDERQAFIAATRHIFDKWAKIIGDDLVKKAEAAIGKR